jgi:hypothetical protein
MYLLFLTNHRVNLFVRLSIVFFTLLSQDFAELFKQGVILKEP